MHGKRKANAAVEPEAGTETPARRVAPRRAVDAAATPPILEEPRDSWEERRPSSTSAGAAGGADASTLVEVDRLRRQLAAQEERLAAQERRSAEWQRINVDMLALTQRINLDMLALTQRVMAMAAEGDGGRAR